MSFNRYIHLFVVAGFFFSSGIASEKKVPSDASKKKRSTKIWYVPHTGRHNIVSDKIIGKRISFWCFHYYVSEEVNKKKMKTVVNISAQCLHRLHIGNVPMFWAIRAHCLRKYTFQHKCYNNNDCVTNEIKTLVFFVSSPLLG